MVFVILHKTQFRQFGKCANTLWSPFGLETLTLCVTMKLFVLSSALGYPSNSVQPLEVLFPQHGLSLFFLPLEVFSRPVFDQICRERFGILHFVIWHRASPGGVAPLPSHCDEWDEICRSSGPFDYGRFSYCLPRVRKLRFIAHSSERQYQKANPPPTSRTSAELLDVNPRLFRGTDDAIHGMDLQAVLGLSYCFSFLRRDSFPFTILRSATVDNVHPCPSTLCSVWPWMHSLLR